MTKASVEVSQPATRSGTFSIGGDLPVNRIGFGAMRIVGKGVWGEPEDKAEALAVLRRSLELGINLIDTADSYGPFVSELLIAEALHPYPEDLVIATKAGMQRTGPNQWQPDGRPQHLRERCEGSLQRLKVDRIDLFQLHRIDSKVPMEDQIGTLADLQREGKIRHIGLSEVSVDDIRAVQKLVTVTTVQNLYNLADRKSEAVLEYCTQQGIGFIPWFPLANAALAGDKSPVAHVAERLGATPGQVALAWLLAKSPVMLPIPGTSKVDHLVSNTNAALLQLDPDMIAELEEGAAKKK
jgi:aryl-alcohol dehydrogenase-like predicted oxidoreductase